jgi:NAD+ kinase
MTLRLGLNVNQARREAAEFADRLTAECRRHGITTVTLDEECPVDIAVAVGGDGTVLETARLALAREVGLLGFNLGTIGFLAEVEPRQLEWVVTRLAAGAYRVEKRMTLQAAIPGLGRELEVGVNDVVVEKIESQRLVVLDVEVDGESFLAYRADGIVIATPTGSTAYAFSAGGPLVDPSLECLLVTPVAPHSLFNRSLVLPPGVSVRVKVADDRPVRVSVDGREIGEVHEGGAIDITRGPTPVGFVRFDAEGFPGRVTRKFGLT